MSAAIQGSYGQIMLQGDLNILSIRVSTVEEIVNWNVVSHFYSVISMMSWTCKPQNQNNIITVVLALCKSEVIMAV